MYKERAKSSSYNGNSGHFTDKPEILHGPDDSAYLAHRGGEELLLDSPQNEVNSHG